MPYVLKHKHSSELFACTLINIYDFSYHGIKFWENRQSAGEEYASFLLEHGVEEIWDWEIAELEEARLKLGNVKLNNNPAKRVYLGEQGRIEVR